MRPVPVQYLINFDMPVLCCSACHYIAREDKKTTEGYTDMKALTTTNQLIDDPDLRGAVVHWLNDNTAEVYAPIIPGEDHRPLAEAIWLYDDLLFQPTSVDTFASKSGMVWRYQGDVFSCDV